MEGKPIIKADVDYVVSTERGTTLEQNNAKVLLQNMFLRHYGCQVDNALITIDERYRSWMASLKFVEAIEKVGYEDQIQRQYFELSENIPWEDEKKA